MSEGVVFEVTHEELVEDIVDAYLTKVPLYIWGRTGIGKSQTTHKAGKILAEMFGRKYSTRLREIDEDHFVILDRRMSYRDPTDLTGVLYKDNGVSRWHYPDWLVKLSKQREEEEGVEIKAILFLDELNLAPPLTQNAGYELVLEGKIEDLELADGVVVIAAGNVAEDRAYTFDLPDPLRTRFTHVTLKVPVFKDEERRQGWFYWATNTNGNKATYVQIYEKDRQINGRYKTENRGGDTDEYNTSISNKTRDIDPRILAFLSFQPNLLFKYVENDRTFPTPRGWEMASKLMANKPNNKAWRVVAKACGYIAGLQFRQFMELSVDVDIEEILKEPKKFLDLEVSVRFSVIASLTHLYSQKPDKYAERLLKLAAHLFTGIYDGKKLNEYVVLAEKCEELSDEGLEKITKKKRELEGEREAELATLILTSMKAANRDKFVEILNSSKYTPAVTDLVFFLI